MNREANRQAAHPGEPHRPRRADASHVVAEMIRHDQGLDVMSTQGANLLQDPDMAAPVTEERRGREHKDPHVIAPSSSPCGNDPGGAPPGSRAQALGLVTGLDLGRRLGQPRPSDRTTGRRVGSAMDRAGLAGWCARAERLESDLLGRRNVLRRPVSDRRRRNECQGFGDGRVNPMRVDVPNVARIVSVAIEVLGGSSNSGSSAGPMMHTTSRSRRRGQQRGPGCGPCRYPSTEHGNLDHAGGRRSAGRVKPRGGRPGSRVHTRTSSECSILSGSSAIWAPGASGSRIAPFTGRTGCARKCMLMSFHLTRYS